MNFIKSAITVLVFSIIFISCHSKKKSDNYLLKNSSLNVEVFSNLSIKVENKQNNNKYFLSKPIGFTLKSVEVLSNKSLFHCLYLIDSIDITVSISLNDNTINFQLIADSLSELSNRIYFPGAISTNGNDHFVIPYATGLLLSVDEEPFIRDFCFWKHGSTMSFGGVTNMKSSYMVISDNPWDTGILYKKPNDSSRFEMNLFHEPSKNIFSYTRNFEYTFFANGDYVDMAKKYRAFAEEKGYVKTFIEKVKENPNIEKLEGALNFWLRGKEFFSSKFINQLYNFGVEKAVLSLSGGWFIRDYHSELIDTINAKGYLSSRYDLLTDVWPPTHTELKQYRTSGYPEEVVVDEQDSLYKGWVSYIDGDSPFQGFIICSQTHPDYIDERLTNELPDNHYNTRFMDVELSLHLLECYSTQHPATRHHDALNRIDALDVVKNKYKLVSGSEEAYDWAFPVTDYSEGTMSINPAKGSSYNWSSPIDEPGENFIKYNINPQYRIPLHGLVYHDVHIPTWYTGDGQSKVPAYWDDKDAFNILYASMQLFMPPNYDYWMLNFEKFLTSYHLASSVFSEAGFAKMTDHQMLTEDRRVQRTIFENGWICTVNFGDKEYKLNDKILPSKGFYVTNGTSAIYRMNKGDGKIAVTNLPDKLFINPYGKTVSINGVRTSGTVVLINRNNFIQIAFIGDEKYIDINPDSLPWDISKFTIETDDLVKVNSEKLDNGWVRINKVADKRFYRLTKNVG